MGNYLESVYGLCNDTKISPPNKTSYPHLETENKKQSRKIGFLLSNYKNLLWSFSDQQHPAAKLYGRMFRRQLRGTCGACLSTEALWLSG